MYNNPAPHPDQKYINAILNNNPILVNELYEKFAPLIKYMVLQNKGTILDAADIFKEALTDIYYKAKTGKLVLTCEFGNFFYIVCRRKWLDKLGKQKKAQSEIDIDTAEFSGDDSFGISKEPGLQQQRIVLQEKEFSKLAGRCDNNWIIV